MSQQNTLKRSIGTWEVTVAGVALVVAASTLVSDFTGFFNLGWKFVLALVLGFGVNLLLGLSAADLSVAYPRAGALYNYAREIFRGRRGKLLAVFLGLAFYGMFGLTASGETSAGAFGFQALFHSDLDIRYFVVGLIVLAAIPNIIGIRTAAWFSAGLLVLMVGIRWFFGLAGFLGFSRTGEWAAENLHTVDSTFALFGEAGVITVGLALAFWTFVGIEFACSLAEEVQSPPRSMPRGLILGLFGILATSLVMGIGVTGTMPLEAWQGAASGSLGMSGEAPQLAVGQLMFGSTGYTLMALASVAATLGSLTVAFAAMPRIIYSLARDGYFFGPLSKIFGALHPRFGTPVAAVLLTVVLYAIPPLVNSAVIDWVYSAAYLWGLLYVAFHVLALASRTLRTDVPRAFEGGWFRWAASAGAVVTVGTIYFAFTGAHTAYGGRALLLLGLVAIATAVAHALRPGIRLSRSRITADGLGTEAIRNQV